MVRADNPEKLEIKLQSQFSSIHLSAISFITTFFCSRLYMLTFFSQGWWFVDLDGEVGWAPASYLEPRDGSEDDQVLKVFKEREGK